MWSLSAAMPRDDKGSEGSEVEPAFKQRSEGGLGQFGAPHHASMATDIDVGIFQQFALALGWKMVTLGEQAFWILQQKQGGRSFGDIAIELGMSSAEVAVCFKRAIQLLAQPCNHSTSGGDC